MPPKAKKQIGEKTNLAVATKEFFSNQIVVERPKKGRPKGSKNKPKDDKKSSKAKAAQKQLKKLPKKTTKQQRGRNKQEKDESDSDDPDSGLIIDTQDDDDEEEEENEEIFANEPELKRSLKQVQEEKARFNVVHEGRLKQREEAAMVLKPYSETDVRKASIKASSFTTYENLRSAVENKHGCEWSVEGLVKFIISAEVAKSVANTTCDQIISAFKFDYKLRHKGAALPAEQASRLHSLVAGRRNLVPDLPRVVGAIGKDQLADLHTFVSCSDCGTDEEKKAVNQLSTMMYGCALRLFQARELTQQSFEYVSENKSLWVTCRAKSTKAGNQTEKKQVHPEFVERIRKILDERKIHTMVFPELNNIKRNAASFEPPIVTLMKTTNYEAARHFCWSMVSSFHGTHNFRHGAAQDAFKVGGLELVMLRTGHQSQSAAAYYSRSNLERDQLFAFTALNAAKQKTKMEAFFNQCKERSDSMKARLQPFAAKPDAAPYKPSSFTKVDEQQQNPQQIQQQYLQPHRRDREDHNESSLKETSEESNTDFIQVLVRSRNNLEIARVHKVTLRNSVPRSNKIWDKQMFMAATNGGKSISFSPCSNTQKRDLLTRLSLY